MSEREMSAEQAHRVIEAVCQFLEASRRHAGAIELRQAIAALAQERPCDSADCQLSGPHTLTEVCYPPKALCRCGCTFEQHDDPTQFRPAPSTGAAS